MIGKEFDTRSKNIDTFMDMISSAQRDNGIKPTMQEALFDPVTKRRINVFERARLEKEGVDLSKYGNSKKSGCSGCHKCDKGEKPMSNIERGVFVYNEDDLIDESDDMYICEYCTKIGYDNAYKPDICDVCDDCEGCTEYLSGECDGCGYSTTYNGGCSYGESNVEAEYQMNSEDSQLIDEIEDGGPDYEVMIPDGKFTIMNY